MPSAVKELMFKEITDEFEKSPYAFFSSFDKLPVSEMMALRQALEKVAKRSVVVKHSFAKKIFEEKKYEGENLLSSSVLVTFGDENPQDISKAIVEFAKSNDKIAPAGVIFEGKVYEKDFVKQLSKLPSRHELLTQVVVRVKSPMSGLVMTLAAVTRGLVIALNGIKEKKEAGTPAA